MQGFGQFSWVLPWKQLLLPPLSSLVPHCSPSTSPTPNHTTSSPTSSTRTDLCPISEKLPNSCSPLEHLARTHILATTAMKDLYREGHRCLRVKYLSSVRLEAIAQGQGEDSHFTLTLVHLVSLLLVHHQDDLCKVQI